MAIVLSLADEATGNFPTCDLAVVMEDYSFLMLPGSGPTCHHASRSGNDWAAGVESQKPQVHVGGHPRHLRGFTQGLAARVGKGSIGRRGVLQLVNATTVPLQLLRKVTIVTSAKMTAAPTEVTSIPAYIPSVPAYSPTRPGLKQ